MDVGEEEEEEAPESRGAKTTFLHDESSRHGYFFAQWIQPTWFALNSK